EELVDRGGGKNLFDDHLGSPEDPGLPGGLRDDDPQVLRSEGEGPAVDHLTNAREKMFPHSGHLAPDDDHRWVEKVDDARDYLADIPARFPNRLHRHRVARTDEFDNPLGAVDRVPLLAQGVDDGVTAREGFQTAEVAAEARDVTCSGHGDVTEVPGRA